jgi:hypothetical protein
MRLFPEPFELSQIAATLAAVKPNADASELAKHAGQLWAACALESLHLQPTPDPADRLPPECRPEAIAEAARLRAIREAPNVPLDKLLVELEPDKDYADRIALYRHFLESKGKDGADSLARHKANGVDAMVAGFIRGEWKAWRKAQTSAVRVVVGSKGGTKTKANKEAAKQANEDANARPRRKKARQA